MVKGESRKSRQKASAYSNLASAPLTLRASAIAVSPEGPILLTPSSNSVSAPLTSRALAIAVAP
eukprot:34431-Prymnesium_polylepis.1